jgi:vacuolar-type H+-ATPase subunit I/STV1
LGVLILTSEDCDQPIRVWLIVLCALLGFHLVFILSVGYLFSNAVKSPESNSISLVSNTIVQCFLFLWMLVGAAWVTNDPSDCKNDFPAGFLVTIIILVVYFGVILVILLGIIGIFFVTCFGSFHISKFLKDEEEEDEEDYWEAYK